jgi:hypothetical protein
MSDPSTINVGPNEAFSFIINMSEDNYGAERRDDSELDSGDEANPSES